MINSKPILKCVIMRREPAVANAFYAGEKALLAGQVDSFLSNAKLTGKSIKNAVSYVAPHAGYKYSGQVAAFAYKALSMKKDLGSIDSFVIIGPNHTGLGYPISVSAADWSTPIGLVKNDLELTREIARGSDRINIDEDAHRLEHSVEVQLPFLQRVVKAPRCCFVCMGDQSLDYCRTLSSAILKGAEALGRKVVVIASSDFNHYESAKTAQQKDISAINELKGLKFEQFHRKIEELEDSACGYGPITVSAMFASWMGAKSGILLKYSNSGEITHDYQSVVAYSSIAFG